MTNANHIGDRNKMVIGDNDHGDSIPTPKCASCGVPWVDHMGIMGVCLNNKALKEDLKDSLEAHDEMRLEITQLRKERDKARRLLQSVVEEFISDTPNKTPTHECEFRSNPERGKCGACEVWGDYIGLFGSEEEEEEETQ